VKFNGADFFCSFRFEDKGLHFAEIGISVDHDWHEFGDCMDKEDPIDDMEKLITLKILML